MKRLLAVSLFVLTGILGVTAQSNPNYPMYHKTVTADKTFDMCPSGTASIMGTLNNTTKPMFIMVTGSA